MKETTKASTGYTKLGEPRKILPRGGLRGYRVTMNLHLGKEQKAALSRFLSRDNYVLTEADAEPTKEEADALLAALDAADDAARRALSQAERNLFNLRDARLEAETARSIAAASNKTAALAEVAL